MTKTNMTISFIQSTIKHISTNNSYRSNHNVNRRITIMTITKYKIIIYNIITVSYRSLNRKFSTNINFFTKVKTSSFIPLSFTFSNSIIKEIESIHILNNFVFIFNKSKRIIIICTISSISIVHFSINVSIMLKSTIIYIIISIYSKWHFCY